MNGIFSATPSLGSIRLLVGSKMLLLVQAWLVLRCERLTGGMMPVIVGLTAVVGVVALVGAIIGEPKETPGTHRHAQRRTAGRSWP
jgi:hypothetical protein